MVKEITELNEFIDEDIVKAFNEPTDFGSIGIKPYWYGVTSPHLVMAILQLARQLKNYGKTN